MRAIREFKQKIAITKVDISCKFYLQKNDVAYTYSINLVGAIVKHQKFLLSCKKSPTVAYSYHIKIRENY